MCIQVQDKISKVINLQFRPVKTYRYVIHGSPISLPGYKSHDYMISVSTSTLPKVQTCSINYHHLKKHAVFNINSVESTHTHTHTYNLPPTVACSV